MPVMVLVTGTTVVIVKKTSMLMAVLFVIAMAVARVAVIVIETVIEVVLVIVLVIMIWEDAPMKRFPSDCASVMNHPPVLAALFVTYALRVLMFTNGAADVDGAAGACTHHSHSYS
ncbi:hypothetical protein N9L19_01140 [bacterium]|nr:hypothetical protein [bacterium]